MTDQGKLTSAKRIKRETNIERDRQIDIEKMVKFYRTPPSVQVPLQNHTTYKKIIESVFRKILEDDEFLFAVFDHHIFLDEGREERERKLNKNFKDKTISLILHCALELFDKIIEEMLEWNINKIYIYNIAIACLSFAIKNIAGFDWLNNDKIIPRIIEAFNKPKPGDPPQRYINFDLKILQQIEFDILIITEGKGCNIYDLKIDYTDYFEYKEKFDDDLPSVPSDSYNYKKEFDNDFSFVGKVMDHIKSIIVKKPHMFSVKQIDDFNKNGTDSKLFISFTKDLIKLEESRKKMPKNSPLPKPQKLSPYKPKIRLPLPKPKKSPSPKSPKKSPSKSAFKKKSKRV